MFKVQRLAVALLLAIGITMRAETNLPVRALGDGRFQVGLVRLDRNSQTVSFPAAVNLRDETIEYAVVHKTGKTHESIFRTSAKPKDIHVAMLLLGAKPMMTNSFGADGSGPPLGEKVFLEASWTNNGARVSYAIEDLVLNRETKQAMPRGEWIYNGSNFSEGAFTAQRDGSIISTHIDPDALINNPRPGRENDDLYAPNAKKLPPIGAPVEITIKLAPTK